MLEEGTNVNKTREYYHIIIYTFLPVGSDGVGGLSPFSPFSPLGPGGPGSPVLFPL